MSSTKTLQLQRSVNFCRQLHFDPGKMAVMVRSGSATHPSNCTRLWCSKYPHRHSEYLPGEAEVRSPGPHHRETDSRKPSPGPEPKQLPLALLPSPSRQILPLASIFPTHVCCAPSFLPSVATQSTRYFSCHFATSGARKASHQRVNVGFSSNPGEPWEKPSHPTPVFALYESRQLVSSQLLILPRLFLDIMHLLITLPMLCPFFHLCFTTIQQPHILFFILQDLCSSSPCCRLRDLVQESHTSFRTLNHLRHFVLMHYLHLFLLVLLFHLLLPLVPFLHGVFPSWMDPRFLTVRRHQFSNPPSILVIHPAFTSDLLRQILHDFHFFAASSLLLPLTLPAYFCRRCRLHSLENSCPAVFTPHSYSVFLVLAHPPPFQRGTSIPPALIHFVLAQTSQFAHFFSVTLPKNYVAFLPSLQ